MTSEVDKALANMKTAEKMFDDFTATTNRATTALGGVGAAADKTSGKFVLLNKAMLGSSNEMRAFITSAKLGEISFTKYGDSAGVATRATQQLSKMAVNANGAISGLNNIVRDAPFGIIGIGNNITQLTDSFAAMRAQTGSATGALAAMASGIFSPAGLLTLGISTVTSLLTVFAMKSREAGDETENLAKKEKSFADIQNESIQSTAGTVERLKILSQVVTDTSKSYDERKRALQELQKENKNYFGDLSLEKSKLEDVKKAVDDYADALTNQAIIKGLQEQLSKTVAEVAKLTPQASDQAYNFFNALSEPPKDTIQKAQKSAQQLVSDINKGIQQGARQATSDIGVGISQDQLAKNAIAPLEDALKRAAVLRQQLTEAIQKALKQKPLESTGEEVKKAYKAFDDLNAIVGQTILTFSRFSHLPGFGIKGLTDISAGVVTEVKKMETALTGFQYTAQAALVAGIKPIQQTAAEIKIAFGSTLLDAVEGITSGLTTDGISAAIGNFSSVLGGFLQNLGKQAIIYSKVLEGLQIAIKNFNPTAALVAGIAAIAAGTALKSYASKVPAFAQGGITNGPTLALVGDNPGGREAIVPSQDWREAFGPKQAEGGYIAEARFSRGDLVLLIKQALKEEGRL